VYSEYSTCSGPDLSIGYRMAHVGIIDSIGTSRMIYVMELGGIYSAFLYSEGALISLGKIDGHSYMSPQILTVADRLLAAPNGNYVYVHWLKNPVGLASGDWSYYGPFQWFSGGSFAMNIYTDGGGVSPLGRYIWAFLPEFQTNPYIPPYSFYLGSSFIYVWSVMS